jgi:hypothetical protein
MAYEAIDGGSTPLAGAGKKRRKEMAWLIWVVAFIIAGILYSADPSFHAWADSPESIPVDLGIGIILLAVTMIVARIRA